MQLDGHIFLCGRNDGHPERHYKGKLTHLSLFDAPLSPANIAALYVSVKGEKEFEQRLKDIAAAQNPQLVEEVPVSGGQAPPQEDGPLVLRTPGSGAKLPAPSSGKVEEEEVAAKENQLTKTITKLRDILNDKVCFFVCLVSLVSFC